MVPIADKQEQINCRRQETLRGYPELWSRITAEWNSPGPDDRAWLMYSANYLFRTAGVRWALDPLTLRRRVPSAPELDVSALAALDFVVLTHRHADHLDLDLLRALREYPIRYIIPESILALVQNVAGLPEKNIIVPVPLQVLEMDGVRFTPFDGFHWEEDDSRPGGRRGVPATGYLVEFSGKRWLVPGDIRTYDATRLPHFGPVDGLIAHLWLGRGCALQNEPQLVDTFCQFCLDLCPKRIVISHLEELGRDVKEYWNELHARKVTARFQELNSSTEVLIARMGESIVL
jgi:L-ascorbate metabolism protein UlaG (beta-lactamase superfamily)